LVVESLHAGSLIVDDIEDDSDLRRDAATLHRIYGVPVALNAGNWLYFWPQVLLSRIPLTDEAPERPRRGAMPDAAISQALDHRPALPQARCRGRRGDRALEDGSPPPRHCARRHRRRRRPHGSTRSTASGARWAGSADARRPERCGQPGARHKALEACNTGAPRGCGRGSRATTRRLPAAPCRVAGRRTGGDGLRWSGAQPVSAPARCRGRLHL
jgi:hypothetical protein